MQGGFVTLPRLWACLETPAATNRGKQVFPFIFFSNKKKKPFNILIFNSHMGGLLLIPLLSPLRQLVGLMPLLGGPGHTGWGEAAPAATLAALMRLSL